MLDYVYIGDILRDCAQVLAPGQKTLICLPSRSGCVFQQDYIVASFILTNGQYRTFFHEILQVTHLKFHMLLRHVNVFLDKRPSPHKFEMQLQSGIFIRYVGLKVLIFNNCVR